MNVFCANLKLFRAEKETWKWYFSVNFRIEENRIFFFFFSRQQTRESESRNIRLNVVETLPLLLHNRHHVSQSPPPPLEIDLTAPYLRGKNFISVFQFPLKVLFFFFLNIFFFVERLYAYLTILSFFLFL